MSGRRPTKDLQAAQGRQEKLEERTVSEEDKRLVAGVVFVIRPDSLKIVPAVWAIRGVRRVGCCYPSAIGDHHTCLYTRC